MNIAPILEAIDGLSKTHNYVVSEFKDGLKHIVPFFNGHSFTSCEVVHDAGKISYVMYSDYGIVIVDLVYERDGKLTPEEYIYNAWHCCGNFVNGEPMDVFYGTADQVIDFASDNIDVCKNTKI